MIFGYIYTVIAIIPPFLCQCFHLQLFFCLVFLDHLVVSCLKTSDEVESSMNPVKV